MKELSRSGKEQVAFALLLLKDFKCEGRFDMEVIKSIFELADHLGVRKEYDDIMKSVPPMRIEPRYQ